MPQLKAVLFDVYGTLVDIHTNEHRDDAFESLSRFLEYRRVFIPGRELKELYFDHINQQIARSRERHPEVDVTRAFGNVLRERGRTTDRYLTMITAQLYRSLSRERLRLFDDTFWTLNEFRKQYRLGIVTDAQRLFCKPELRTLRYIGNKYETDLVGAKEAGLAVAGLIRQAEEEKRDYRSDSMPDFVTDDLRGALQKISGKKQDTDAKSQS